VATSLKN